MNKNNNLRAVIMDFRLYEKYRFEEIASPAYHWDRNDVFTRSSRRSDLFVRNTNQEAVLMLGSIKHPTSNV